MSSPWSVTKPRFSQHFWFLSVGQISLTNQPPYPTILLPWAHLWAISPLRFWELKCPSGFKGAQYVDSIITSSKPAVHSLTHGEAKSPVRTSVRIMRWKRLFPEWPMTWTAIVVFKRGWLWEPGICPSAKQTPVSQCFSVLARKHFLLIEGGATM